MSSFWRLSAPGYSDYHHTFINGELEHPFRLPGICCDSCGQRWVDSSRVLPLVCPETIRPILLSRPKGPVSFAEFNKLCETIRAALPRALSTPPELRPGNRFLPGMARIPSIPRADFLWGCSNCPLVSERIKKLFQGNDFAGFFFSPATIAAIGRQEATLAPPIPTSGEPEDIMLHAQDPAGAEIGSYSELVVVSDSLRVPATVPHSICKVCGFGNWSPPKRWAMEENLSTGADVFFLAPTTMVVVSDRVKEALVGVDATNVLAQPI